MMTVAMTTMKIRTNNQSTYRWIPITLGIIFVAILIGYIIQRTSAWRTGPEVITNITDGQTFLKQSITLEGTTEHTVELLVNNRSIILADDGSFAEPLLLSRGYNIIVIEARDRFGKSTEYHYELVSSPTLEEPLSELPVEE
jgi:hypothetical protein